MQHRYVTPCQQTKISSTLNTDFWLDDPDVSKINWFAVDIAYSTNVYKSIRNEVKFVTLWVKIDKEVVSVTGVTIPKTE